MGRPRLPDELKALQGTLRPDRRLQDAAEAVPAERMRVPKGFDELERSAYREVFRAAKLLCVLSETDLQAVELCAVALASVRRTYERPREERDARGLRDDMRLAEKMLSVLGLTPQSRSTVRAMQRAPEADAIDEFLSPPEEDGLN